MDQRVKALEDSIGMVRDRLTKIEVRLDYIPTKAELHKEISDQTWKFFTWMTTISAVLVAAAFAIAKYVLK